MSKDGLLVGVDIGGTTIKLAIIDETSEIVEKWESRRINSSKVCTFRSRFGKQSKQSSLNAALRRIEFKVSGSEHGIRSPEQWCYR